MGKPVYDESNDDGLNDDGLNDVDTMFHGTNEEYAQHLRENGISEDEIVRSLERLGAAREERKTAQIEADDHPTLDYRDRIVMDPRILVGKPTIKGTRFPVSKILNLLGHGATFEKIVGDYPILTKEDIRAAILFAEASLSRDDVYAISYRR